MGHNVSNYKRHRAVMHSKLGEFSTWRLAIDCGAGGCSRGRAYDVKALAAFYPGLTLVASPGVV